MKNHISSCRVCIVAIAIIISLPLHAELKGLLTASKIVVVNNAEQRQPADKAKPGDIIEYVAEYRNTSKSSVSNVIATLPVPSGMEYVVDTANPLPVTASTDDHNYAPVPLQRTVRAADGSTVSQPVPLSEYKSLRWNLGEIAGEASKSVKARMKVRVAQ